MDKNTKITTITIKPTRVERAAGDLKKKKL
jgi:hypothetical protein